MTTPVFDGQETPTTQEGQDTDWNPLKHVIPGAQWLVGEATAATETLHGGISELVDVTQLDKIVGGGIVAAGDVLDAVTWATQPLMSAEQTETLRTISEHMTDWAVSEAGQDTIKSAIATAATVKLSGALKVIKAGKFLLPATPVAKDIVQQEAQRLREVCEERGVVGMIEEACIASEIISDGQIEPDAKTAGEGTVEQTDIDAAVANVQAGLLSSPNIVFGRRLYQERLNATARQEPSSEDGSAGSVE